MSKRVYHLTIEFDPETEDIEYIMENDSEGKKNYRIRGPFLQAEI